ncbi:hypothetical protein BVC80_1065g3 [Macleaya cordata]|uniref:Uncharacterized protein n=1 Tax=Macleaya cordata TaxID=56857 RepID=A0A200RCM7_MACCD|nr:hypothetical protein BVC80_1065g3 [Macleaya cordata]
MLGRPLILQRDVKRLKVSALLEGSCSQNDEAAGSSKTNESIVSRNFIYNLSDVTHELAEETMIGSPTKNYNSGDDEETIAEYPDDIYELFKKLVMMLRNEAPPNQSTRGIFGDAPTQGNVSEIQNQIGSQEQEEVKILKAIWHYSKEFFEWVTLSMLGHPLILQRDVKRLKVSALLKGSCSQNDEAAGSSKTNESIVSRNFIYNLSDVTHELAEETMIGSPTKNYNSGDDEETIAEYPDDIYELFKKLVMMLRNEAPPNQSTRGIFGDAPTQGNVSEIQNQIGSQEQEEVKILKAIWHYSKEFFEWVTL